MLRAIKSFLSIVSAGWRVTCTFCLYSAVSIVCCFSFSFNSKAQSFSYKADVPKGPRNIITLPLPTPVSAAAAERIQDACNDWYVNFLSSKGFNGGMVVAKNGNIIFEKYRGTDRIPGKNPVDENTSLQIASTSKTFTAMAVLKLWQDEKLNLDDPFSKYFPQFNYPGVTIRTLLDHRSGLPNYLNFMEDKGWDESRYVHNQNVLDYLIKYRHSLDGTTPANIHFRYCNTNFVLLALLIEKVTGKPFPQFMKETFFDPLQMKNTFIFSPESGVDAAPSYDFRGKIVHWDYLDAVYGDKNVYTTPRDLLIWDRALSCNIIFNPATLAEAYKPYSHENRGIKNYGLGWRMYNYPNGKKIIYHNGWWHGSNSAFIRLIQDSATIIIIGNKYNRNIYKAKKLAPVFGNYPSVDEGDEAENNVQPSSTTHRRRHKIIITGKKHTSHRRKR